MATSRRTSGERPRRRRAAKSQPDGAAGAAAAGGQGGLPLPSAGPAPAMSVSALLSAVKGALADAFPDRVRVAGEISNFKHHSSGHMYFRMKDSAAAIDVAMFRSYNQGLRFRPADGLEVVVEGRVDVYEARGQLQLYAERMTPVGEGALELALRQLRAKLSAEGLFDPARKKPLPRFPSTVGVITSPTGAAIRDIRRTLSRRWPGLRVYLMPVLVQGTGAAEQIAEAIGLMDAAAGRLGIEAIIVGRGGGSLEDLWAFNEELVARAVAAAATPIISGVGHEVDVTICDQVADVRAATPTAAAELAVPDAREVAEALAALGTRLRRAVARDLEAMRSQLDGVMRSVVFRDPLHVVRSGTQRTDELAHRLAGAQVNRLAGTRRLLEGLTARLAAVHPGRIAEQQRGRVAGLEYRLRWALGKRSKEGSDRLSAARSRLSPAVRGAVRLSRQQVQALGRQLEAMSYRSVLRRGFSVTRGDDGAVLRSASQAQPGERIETELPDGRVASEVLGAGPPAAVTRRPRRRTEPTAGPTLFDTDANTDDTKE